MNLETRFICTLIIKIVSCVRLKTESNFQSYLKPLNREESSYFIDLIH